MLNKICIGPVWLRLSQELSLLQRAGANSKLLYHCLGWAAVTENLSQDHLRNINKHQYEFLSANDGLSNTNCMYIHRKAAISSWKRGMLPSQTSHFQSLEGSSKCVFWSIDFWSLRKRKMITNTHNDRIGSLMTQVWEEMKPLKWWCARVNCDLNHSKVYICE